MLRRTRCGAKDRPRLAHAPMGSFSTGRKAFGASRNAEQCTWVGTQLGRIPVKSQHPIVVVGAGMAGLRAASASAAEPFAPLPWFWTDQGALKIRGYGSPASAHTYTVTRGVLSAAGLVDGVVVKYYSHSGLVAIVAINIPMDELGALRTAVRAATEPTTQDLAGRSA
jgi:hypothetical protein